MMNVFISLEDVLSPGGESKAPAIGMMVHDWDENVSDMAGKIVDLGYTVSAIPSGLSYSGESSVNGIVEEDPVPKGRKPLSMFYYKGKPKDVVDDIPVLTLEDGKVMVSTEGRVKELAEHLGMLADDDDGRPVGM